ncbi:sensor histidine kinase [Actinoplanes sp. NPDC051633]|uniref:sensor histidine kinase n=1 Tax=Actinoplanes sp. NPDC051633 TaxID=3155670 RepID=UPI00341910FA
MPYVRYVDEAAWHSSPGQSGQSGQWQSAHWRDRRPHGGGPPIGAAIGAGLFHVFGARDAAADGLLYHRMDVLVYALLLAGPLALCWRRRAPIPVLVVATAASLAFATLAAPRWMFMVAPIVALFGAVKKGRARAALGVVAAGYVAYPLLTVVLADRLEVNAGAQPGLRELLVLAGTLAVTMFLGRAAKAQAEHMAEAMKTRAERAKAKEEQERRQASEERLRMARELHDVLGHHLSLINVQAGVGLHLMDNRPEQAREALTAIKTASSEALREVRAVLGVLRPEEEVAPRQPALGLDRLDELTESAGLPVTTTISGASRPLPAEVDRAAYRIVQEALTNVRKHAAADAKAEVTVSFSPGSLDLSVRNDGLAPEMGDGSGITGMRARAETLGGSLQAGPLPGGGFLVTASLPTSGDAK